jgi:hypothetical protein
MGKLMAVLCLAGALALTASPAAYSKGQGGRGGSSHGHSAGSGHVHRFAEGRRVGFHGSHTPPGWSHGRKVGWNGGHEPPGLGRH